jgi:hypothetical protein
LIRIPWGKLNFKVLNYNLSHFEVDASLVDRCRQPLI